MQSNLNLHQWERELATDCDKQFIMDGITNGFHIVDPNVNLEEVVFNNHKSACEPSVRSEVENLIHQEISFGNYVVTTKKPMIVSALGTVKKSDGGLRLIHDCSLPVGKSLNSYAPSLEKYSYESVDTAVSMIQEGFYLAKVDIKSAYRNIPIHPRSQEATGLQWTFENGEHVYFYDCKLPFGGRASPYIFHRISQAIKRMMIRLGFSKIVAYLDDFLLIGESYEECLSAWQEMKELLSKLGLPLNERKLVAPCQVIEFLGISINTKLCTLSLPKDKLADIHAVLAQYLKMKRVSKRQLQVLAGKLNFAAKCVRGARTFLRRILNGIKSLKRPHHKIKLQGCDHIRSAMVEGIFRPV